MQLLNKEQPFMKTFFILLIAFVLLGCDSKNDLPKEPAFTSADSTAMVKVIMDSLRSEYEHQTYMEVDKITHTCGYGYLSGYLSVRVNKVNSVMVNDEIDEIDHGNITKSVVEFYYKNMYDNDLQSYQALYTRLTKREIVDEINNLKDEIKLLRKENGMPEIIIYKVEHLKEWQEKLNILALSGQNTLREPSTRAGISFSYQNELVNQNILDSLLLGYYKLREIDASDYFKESYAKICWKAIKLGDTIANKKMEAFKILHPVNLIDEKKYRRLFPPIPPPFPPARIIDPVKLPIDIIVQDSIDIVPKTYSN